MLQRRRSCFVAREAECPFRANWWMRFSKPMIWIKKGLPSRLRDFVSGTREGGHALPASGLGLAAVDLLLGRKRLSQMRPTTAGSADAPANGCDRPLRQVDRH